MRNLFINYLFSYQSMQVLFWTLIHSLWQGIVFAFFTAIILLSTKKSATALRYKLLSSVLMLFIITSAFTFCYEVASVTNYNTESYKPVIASSIATVVVNNSSVSVIEKLISFLQAYENLIVLSWFAVIILKCVGLMKGLHDVYILKHREVFDAGRYWNSRLQILAENAGIKKQIQLLKSQIAKVPMVVGYFKPVILFPAAALTALAPEEIEAILLHELAHIRRKDYLINIFQRIAEIIFFFNPAVLWISSLIKEERENCCDDIAVKQTKNKKQFIHALVSFQEYNTSGYTTSFSGRKNFLLSRIKRIITNNNKTLTVMEKTFLIAGIVVTAFTAFAFSQHKQLSFKNISALQSIQIKPAEKIKDTVPEAVNNNESKYTINSTLHGKQYRLVEVNGKVTELYVDNVKVPDDKISDYNDIVKELRERFDIDSKNRHEEMQAQAEALKAQIDAMALNKLAIDSQVQANAKDVETRVKELQGKIAMNELANNSDSVREKVEALKAQALAMNDAMKDKIAEIKLEGLNAQEMQQKNLMMKDQAMKLAEAMKEKDADLKEQAKKFAEIAKQNDVMMKEQIDKQTKMIKDKTDKIINQELKLQIEQLKQQNEELKQQLRLNLKIDSLHISPAIPQGA